MKQKKILLWSVEIKKDFLLKTRLNFLFSFSLKLGKSLKTSFIMRLIMLIDSDKLIPKFEIKYNYTMVNSYLRQFKMSETRLICF